MKSKRNTYISLFSIVLFLFSCKTDPTEITNPNSFQQQNALINTLNNEEDEIKKFVKKHFALDLNSSPDKEQKLTYYPVDLNKDGQSEYMLYLNDSYFCGSGGCTLAILNNTFELINEYDIIEPPIYISNSTQCDWLDIIMIGYEEDGSQAYIRLVYDTELKAYPTNLGLVEIMDGQPTTDDIKLWGEDLMGASEIIF